MKMNILFSILCVLAGIACIYVGMRINKAHKYFGVFYEKKDELREQIKDTNKTLDEVTDQLSNFDEQIEFVSDFSKNFNSITEKH